MCRVVGFSSGFWRASVKSAHRDATEPIRRGGASAVFCLRAHICIRGSKARRREGEERVFNMSPLDTTLSLFALWGLPSYSCPLAGYMHTHTAIPGTLRRVGERWPGASLITVSWIDLRRAPLAPPARTRADMCVCVQNEAMGGVGLSRARARGRAPLGREDVEPSRSAQPPGRGANTCRRGAPGSFPAFSATRRAPCRRTPQRQRSARNAALRGGSALSWWLSTGACSTSPPAVLSPPPSAPCATPWARPALFHPPMLPLRIGVPSLVYILGVTPGG